MADADMEMADSPGPGAVIVPAGEWVWTLCVRARDNLEEPPGTIMTVVLGSGGPGPKRNNAIKHVLTTPDCEWIFFLDSDMTPEPQALMRLLAHDVPIAGALCYARLPPFHPVVGLLPGQERLDLTSGPFKAAWTGAAATLVRREVLV